MASKHILSSERCDRIRNNLPNFDLAVRPVALTPSALQFGNALTCGVAPAGSCVRATLSAMAMNV